MASAQHALHAQVRADLEAGIRNGRWRPGDKLPTEAELQRQYGVSRITAQRAMRDLTQTGLVVRHRSRGSFVAQNATEENLLRFTNLIPHGPEVEGAHQVLAAHVVQAADGGVDMPDVGPDEPVHLLHRSKFGLDDKPTLVEKQLVVFRHAPHLLDEPLDTLTTLHYYSTHRIPVARSRMYVEPVNLSDDVAAHLDTKPGTATVRLRRLLWLESGELLEAGLHILAPGTLHLYVEQNLFGNEHARKDTPARTDTELATGERAGRRSPADADASATPTTDRGRRQP